MNIHNTRSDCILLPPLSHRLSWVVLVVLALLMAGCVPLGSQLHKTDIVWSDQAASIERREIDDKFFAIASPVGPRKAYNRRAEFWYRSPAGLKLLDHLDEDSPVDARGFHERYFLKTILGDRSIRRWVQVSYHITSRAQANVFLTLFDEDKVITRVEIDGCLRRFSNKGFTTPEHFSIELTPDHRRIRFTTDQGNGFVDLKTGQKRAED